MSLAQYLESYELDRTVVAYTGLPLSDVSATQRGHMLERVARRIMEEITGETAAYAPVERQCNGRRRGSNSSTYDFRLGTTRYEVKSTQLAWDCHMRRWRAQWKNIKRYAHDKLILVLYTPAGVFFIEHNDTFGLSTHGQSTRGEDVVVVGRTNCEDVTVALIDVVNKLRPMVLRHLCF